MQFLNSLFQFKFGFDSIKISITSNTTQTRKIYIILKDYYLKYSFHIF